ncbi:MAG: CBS domain-containing protein [Rubrivivax sp.]|nr:CBS domain-containing protein [Rubrivivax sp.]
MEDLMYGERIGSVMKAEELLVAGPTTSVADAVRRMVASGVSAVVVVDRERITGIFTERDAVWRVLAQAQDPGTTRLAAVMTAPVVTVSSEQSFGRALALMHEHGIRHLPVVENDLAVGIVTARDALDPELEEFVCEARRREAIR